MKTLTLRGWLRQVDDYEHPVEGRKTVRGFEDFISTFNCSHYTVSTFYIAKLLGTEKKIWDLVVTMLREEMGPDVKELDQVDVEEEIKDDVTGEIAALVDVEKAIAGEKNSLSMMRRVLGLPPDSPAKKDVQLTRIRREMATLEQLKMQIIKEDAERRERERKAKAEADVKKEGKA